MSDEKMVEITLSEDDARSLCIALAKSSSNVCDDVRAQIREQVKPAMEEPTVNGTVVETDCGPAFLYDSSLRFPWVVISEAVFGSDDSAKTWSQLKNPRPVEAEVPDGYIMIKRPGIDYDYTPGSVATEYLNEDVTSIHGTDLLQRGTITDLCRAYLDAKNEEFNK